MELNEIKNQLANLMSFSRVNLSSGVEGDAFAQLLNKTSSAEKSPAQEVARENKAEKDIRPNDKDERVENKTSSSEDKKRPEANDNRAEQKTDSVEDKKPEASRQDTDKNMSKDDNVSQDASVAKEGDEVSQGSAEEGAQTEKSEKAANQIVVPLADLSMMGIINVVNPESGELVQMTGAELAAQLAGDNTLQVMMRMPQEGGESVFTIVPLEAEAKTQMPTTSEADGVLDVSNFVAATDDDVAKLNMEEIKAQLQDKGLRKDVAAQEAVLEEVEGQKISEQAAKLSEVIGKEVSKAEIKVSVKEEKISQLSSNDLLAGTNSTSDSVALQAQATTMADDVAVKDLNVMPTFNVASSNMAEVSVGSVSQVAAVEANSSNPNTAVVAGSEFVKAAKADASAESNQTSFRDIYKGMSKEIIDQVKVNITKSAVKGIDKIDISLKPVDLGHIEVKMQIGKDGKLQAHIISSRPETMEVLQKEIQTLEKAFNDAGFQTDEGSLSFSFRGGNQANQNQEHDNGLRNFIGDIFEKEASNDLLAGDAFQNQSWNGTTGLNIRV